MLMIKWIFYKEWIKTRSMLLFSLLLSVGFLLYTQIRIGRVVELKGAAHLWEIMLMKDVLFIEILRYVPLVVGLLLGLAQYIPEIHHKRLKLTLHLPVQQSRIIFVMAAYGFLWLLLLFLLHYLWLGLYLQQVVAPEFVSRILLSAAPWYLAGMAGYAFTAWICIEPAWKQRVVLWLFSVAFLRLYYLVPYPEAYNRLLPLALLLSLLPLTFAWLSVLRFKEGKQD